MIDWIDMVEIGGRQYAHQLSPGPTTVPADRIGAEIGITRCHIADTTAGPHFTFHDGDATFLPVGSQVHAIRGVNMLTAVAVYRAGQWLYYKSV